MRIAVIGSGHAAISACEALIAQGHKPVVFDVSETLPTAVQSRVDVLRDTPPDAWRAEHTHFPPPPYAGKLPRKTVFGSDYLYGEKTPFAPLRQSGTTAAPSFAKGGFSMGWGGATLPARAEDLGDWPFSAERLTPYYEQALSTMPLAATEDGLSTAFPLHHHPACAAQPSLQGQRLLADFARVETRLNQGRTRVAFGAARLAVDMGNCTRCAMCLTGCPYDLIYRLDHVLERMVADGKVDYRPSAYVVSVEESGEDVQINWLDTSGGERRSDRFERVFVGAGALSTTRLMLASLDAYDIKRPLKDSAKFAIPMLRLAGANLDWPHTNTLADAFAEIVFEDLSPHWMHIQISPLNEMMVQALHMQSRQDPRALNVLGKLARPLLSRFMVAWCALHSDLSSECAVSISKGEKDLPVLNVEQGVQRSPANVKAYGRALARLGWPLKTLFATPATMLSPTASTGHCGGTFPMRAQPDGPFESDLLGRPNGWRRVHIVDPAAFPSIPATTIALLIRANARRIVTETVAEVAP